MVDRASCGSLAAVILELILSFGSMIVLRRATSKRRKRIAKPATCF